MSLHEAGHKHLKLILSFYIFLENTLYEVAYATRPTHLAYVTACKISSLTLVSQIQLYKRDFLEISHIQNVIQ